METLEKIQEEEMTLIELLELEDRDAAIDKELEVAASKLIQKLDDVQPNIFTAMLLVGQTLVNAQIDSRNDLFDKVIDKLQEEKTLLQEKMNNIKLKEDINIAKQSISDLGSKIEDIKISQFDAIVKNLQDKSNQSIDIANVYPFMDAMQKGSNFGIEDVKDAVKYLLNITDDKEKIDFLDSVVNADGKSILELDKIGEDDLDTQREDNLQRQKYKQELR